MSDPIMPLRRTALALAAMIALGSASAAASDLANTYQGADAQRMNLSAISAEENYTHYIVSYHEDSYELSSASARQNDLKRVAAETGMRVTRVRTLATGDELVEVRGDVARFSRNEDVQLRVMQAFARNTSVVSVEPDRRMTIAAPNDTHWGVQWALHAGAGGLDMTSVWPIATGAGVRVAVLDTGITTHSDLTGRVIGGYDFVSNATNARDGNGRDSNPRDEGDWFLAGECGSSSGSNSSWHGTHVTGTVVASTNNNKGVAGMAYGATVVPVRVLAKCGGTTSDIVDAIVWASGGSVPGVPSNPHPAKVLNLSLGGGGSCGSAYQNAVNSARSRGSVVVVAAGNSNANVANFTPASCSNVIAVASTTKAGARSSFSNYGAGITVSAPGGGAGNDIASTVNAGTREPTSEGYAYMAGTSMAAPHVAAMAALMLEVNPSLTPAQVTSYMVNNARPLPGACSGGCGAGIIDPAATLAALGAGGPGPDPDPPTPGEVTLSNGVPVSNISGGSGEWSSIYRITVPAGATNLSVNMSGGSGDADLYLRFGSAPTTSSYDCRPYRYGNNESCTVAAPSAGTYYVRIRGYQPYSGVSLVASYDAPASGNVLQNGVPVTGLSATAGNWTQTYTFNVPAGATNLRIETYGGSGDSDMYVRIGSEPTTSQYDCRPYRAGNSEACVASSASPGVYYVRMRAYQSFSGLTLKASYTP